MRHRISKLARAGALGSALFLGPLAGVAAAQMVEDRPTATRQDDGMDWGWIGLLGLAGLAGLMGRERRTTAYPAHGTATSSTTPGRV